MNRLANTDAEVSILGSVLLDGTLFEQLDVKEEHFNQTNHREIFRAMEKVVKKGQFIDMVTVTTELGRGIAEVGGTTYLLQMAESVPSTASFKHHEQLIFDAYRMRQTRAYTLRFTENPTDQALDTLVTQLQACRDIGMGMQEKTLQDYLLEITDEMCFPVEEQAGFCTSFTDLDAMTGGLQRGELFIVAARPSVGKTALALNLAAAHVKKEGAAMVFSLEMGTKQLLQRMISAEARINSQKWRNMVFTTEDYERAIHVVGEMSAWNLAIYDQLRTVSSIRSEVRRRVREAPEVRDVIFIDYLQLMIPTGRHERRDLEIGEMTRELKSLAVELDIPIVLLSQLSRGVESRQNKRPLMSDLRESGNIEQDADVVSFLYREDYYSRENRSNQLEIILAKQRNGPTGTIKLAFHKETGRFEDVV